jgi:hypothetical protein
MAIWSKTGKRNLKTCRLLALEIVLSRNSAPYLCNRCLCTYRGCCKNRAMTKGFSFDSCTKLRFLRGFRTDPGLESLDEV